MSMACSPRSSSAFPRNLPPSTARASSICRSWRSLVTDAQFLRRFPLPLHHRHNPQLWKRKIDPDGVVSWGLTRAIELDKLLSLNLKEKRPLVTLVYAEENNVLLLWTVLGIFTVQLESLQFKKLPNNGSWTYYLPFETVYTAGIGGRLDQA